MANIKKKINSKKHTKDKKEIDKQVLTRIVEQSNDKREKVYRIDFKIPEHDTEWMWLATIGDRKKAKMIAQMCREGRL